MNTTPSLLRLITPGLAALSLLAGAAHAQVPGQPALKPAQPQVFKNSAGFVLEAGVEFGGDDVATVFLNNGDDDDVTTGDGIVFAAGGYVRPNLELPLTFSLTGGYKFDQTVASDSDLGMRRFAVEALASWEAPNGFFVAGGITHHFDIKLDGDGLVDDVNFEDATGPTIELGWRWIVARYTVMDYEVEGRSDELDANSFGIRGRFAF